MGGRINLDYFNQNPSYSELKCRSNLDLNSTILIKVGLRRFYVSQAWQKCYTRWFATQITSFKICTSPSKTIRNFFLPIWLVFPGIQQWKLLKQQQIWDSKQSCCVWYHCVKQCNLRVDFKLAHLYQWKSVKTTNAHNIHNPDLNICCRLIK